MNTNGNRRKKGGATADERWLLAEFASPDDLIRAARSIAQNGYTRFDCHAPFHIHGLDEAIGLGRSRLGYVVGVVAIVALTGAVALQWWTHVVSYPTIISGKPLFSYQAFLPVAFALTVLSSAIAATLGMLVFNRLPVFFHPLFASRRFGRVTDDRFFISIESSDPQFDLEKTAQLLKSLGAVYVELVRDEGKE